MKKKSSKKDVAPEAGGVKKGKHSRRFKPGTVAVRDIRKAQRHGNRGIPKSVIDGLVREIASNFSADNTEMRFKKSALRTLHEAAEGFQTDLFRLAGTLSLHAKRKTLDEKSLKLASTLMLCPHVFQETQGTSKAMKGCLASQIKIDWKRPSFPKDADSANDDKAAAEKAAKKVAKAAAKQAAADEAADEPVTDDAAAAVDEGFMSADE